LSIHLQNFIHKCKKAIKSTSTFDPPCIVHFKNRKNVRCILKTTISKSTKKRQAIGYVIGTSGHDMSSVENTENDSTETITEPTVRFTKMPFDENMDEIMYLWKLTITYKNLNKHECETKLSMERADAAQLLKDSGVLEETLSTN